MTRSSTATWLTLSAALAASAYTCWYLLRNRQTTLQQGPLPKEITCQVPSLLLDEYVIHSKLLGKYGAKKYLIVFRGGFSLVVQATCKKSGKNVAIKIIDKKHPQLKQAQIRAEIEIMKKLKHVHIVQMYNVWETETSLFIVLELLSGGELFDRIVNTYPNGYSELVASCIVKQLIESLSYLHNELHIIHRDLKPENVLLSNNDNSNTSIKVSDFGLAVYENEHPQQMAGSLQYMAPEVLATRQVTPACDMWAAGVILYILLCGFPPFQSDTSAQLKQLIQSQQPIEFPSPYWDHISASAKDLVTRLLNRNALERLTSTQALQHPWIQGTTALQTPITSVVVELAKFNAKQKLRAAMHSIKALNRITKVFEN